MSADQESQIIPVIREELHAETRPVHTGSVRVTKTVETHEQLLEQELRKGRADVQRVAMHELVNGPLEPRRDGNTLVIPVVSEEVVEGCGKRWVLTEEIRVTQIEESEVSRQRVPVSEEHARVERLDANGNVISSESEPERTAAEAVDQGSSAHPRVMERPERAPAAAESGTLRSIVNRPEKQQEPARVLSKPQSILRKKIRE